MKTVKELRQAANLTQFRLAVKLDVSQATVQQIEAGRQMPKVDLAIRIARFFGVAVEGIEWGERPAKAGEE